MADGAETAMVYHIDNGNSWSLSLAYGKTKVVCELGKTDGPFSPGIPARLRESLQVLSSAKDALEYENALTAFLRELNACCRENHSAGIVNIFFLANDNTCPCSLLYLS